MNPAMDRRMFAGAGLATWMVGASDSVAAVGPDKNRVEAAVVAGFPLFEFARTAWSSAGPSAKDSQGTFNRVTHRRRLTDPASRVITTPNNDCLVSTSRLDLSLGPLLVDIPDILDRYFSVVFLDAFTDNFFVVGTRATGGRGGRFLLVPPDWRGKPIRDAQTVRSPSTDVWMLARILVDGPQDYPRVNSLQDRLLVQGLSGDPTARPVPATLSDIQTPARFLAIVNTMLGRSPLSDRRVQRAVRLGDVGVRRGKPEAFADLPPAVQRAWSDAISSVLARLGDRAGKEDRREFDGWSYSLASTGKFGDDDFQRAQIALIGLAALPPEEAFYGQALSDSTGAPLTGASRYRLRVPAGGPPVNAFWSVTMYQVETDGRLFLTPNPINRYSIGDRTAGLQINADGSLDLYLQHEPPGGSMMPNWLPTPAGPFRPGLRAYLAKPELLDLRWRMPPIERVA